MPAQPIFGDSARRHLGLLSIEETAALADSGVVIPDPTSTLVSPDVAFGEGVVLWPGTILQRCDEGSLELGAGTILYPGTRSQGSRVALLVGAIMLLAFLDLFPRHGRMADYAAASSLRYP